MDAAEGGWRDLKVVRRVRESATVVSLHLAPADGGAPPPFEPGQFLTFRLAGPDGRPLARNYSISSDPAERGHYRISVKREPDGIGSGAMHELMQEGAIISASGPKGRFTLDRASRRPVLLLAGGIGVTPLLSMAHALAREGERHVWLIHACLDGAVMPFAHELTELERHSPRFKRLAVLAAPTDDDRAVRRHHFEGLVTRDLLRAVLPLDDYEAYLCGPGPFMQAMFDALLQLGLREERIAYEFFGPARKLTVAAAVASSAPTPAATPAPPPPPARSREDEIIVTFALSGRAAPWDGAHRTLLDFAESQGLEPAFSCRNGICNTCLCEIEGSVRYVEEPLEEPGAGQALLCCSVPDGSLTVRI